MKNLEASSVTKVTIYKTKKKKKRKKKKKAWWPRKKKDNWVLIYFIIWTRHRKKSGLKNEKISRKIISLVYLISLISYCNMELKRNKQKNNYSTYTNK